MDTVDIELLESLAQLQTMSAASRSVDTWLNNLNMNRVGMVTLEMGGQQDTCRLQLTDDWLVLMKEEVAYTYSPIDKIDPVLLTKERQVEIRREKVGGLGLSVKGGAEHNLPILISRIFKDQAADRTGQLFVGDAILKVNGTKLDNCQHDEAVQCLKRAGEAAILTVKYFRPASIFLSQQRKTAMQTENDLEADGRPPGMDDVMQPEKQWTELLSMHLLCAYITKYVPGTDDPRSCGFEVMSMEGQSTGPIFVDNTQLQSEWIQTVMDAISRADLRFIEMFNKTLVIEQHLQHMCWVCERANHVTPLRQSWQQKFLTFRGSDVSLYDVPPVKDKDWRKFENSYKIYECMFRILKNDELEDDRTFCFVLETGPGSIHYLSVETRQEILRLEKAWHWANHNAIRQLKSKTYGCMWRGKVAGFTLDMEKGFALYDSEQKCYVWSYKFSQLRGSSDNGYRTMKMHFLNDAASAIEMREIECTNLRTVLFAIQAFLCARLAGVDPKFLAHS